MKETIAVLRKELLHLEEGAQKVRDLIKFFGGDGGLVQSTQLPPPLGEKPLDAAAKLLGEQSPLARRVIIAMLANQGVNIEDADIFSQMLSKDERFEAVGKGPNSKWKLKGQQLATEATA